MPKVRTVVVYGGTVPNGMTSWDELLAAASDDEPAPPSDPSEAGAAMIYTSGTTGKPKGALRTRTDRTLVFALLDKLNLLHENSVHLTTGPLYHSGPLAFASLAHTLGAPIVVLRKFDAARWIELVREHRVTNTFSAPTQLKRIASLADDVLAKADMSSMITLIANAAPVPYSLKEEIVAKLGDGFLYEVYGSTELGVDTVLEPQDQLRKPGSCGRPYGGIEIRIVDDQGNELPAGEAGELFVRTTLAMDGYYRTEQQLTEIEAGEWKSVGDVAYVDDEGFVYICDRKKDMIISGGVNIYPAEIEAVLYAHPQILDAAVFGVPDEEWGERVFAIVQAKPGEAVDFVELRAFVEPRLAAYKRPRDYELRDELPRTDSGKLLKRVLRDEYWKDRDTAV
jgi:acyl-CoA synthetase (AMP-forming)/AMP-acid ligase II